ncbi:MAG: DnaJ C-terminal domain-containing protein [Clostridia bacterium]|nr:DnaJ C-terminal domain-containing protein [Clostridia bacterium]MDD4375244.1 DnaJ C-terminal domain-containing protein [Clostridia bacterium]
MKQKDYYKLLGVNKKSSQEEIKVKYRKLAKKYHPDANINNAEAENLFKDLNEAYNTLMDKDKKKKYDKQVARYGYGSVELNVLNNETKNLNSNVVSELMSTILGFSRDTRDKVVSVAENVKDDIKEKIDLTKEPKKGENIETTLYVTLEEGFFGAEKKISFKTTRGSLKNYSVNVPMGIRDGEKIRLSGLGKPGKNGGKNGDLIILVKLRPHSILRLEGSDIHIKLDLTPVQAIIGDRILLKVFGEKISIEVPIKSKTGDTLEIQSKGYVVNQTTRGNLIIEINIVMPTELSEREIKLYEQLLKVEKQKIKSKITKSEEN